MDSVDETARKIKEMEIQGAVVIALTAAKALDDLARNSKAKTKEEFIKEIENAAKELILTRPSAISLPNLVNEFVRKVESFDGTLDEIKEKAYKAGKELIENAENAKEEIAEKGSGLIKEGMAVFTHCHSSTVTGILKKAWEDGKKFKVVCTETRPWHQGFITARELSEEGIPTTLIVDSAASVFLKDSDLVIVGADTIMKNKDVVNKIGTAQIALLAKQFDVPFYVATQKLKFNKEDKTIIIEERPAEEIIDQEKLPDVDIRNPVFDITEAKYIRGIITQDGIINI